VRLPHISLISVRSSKLNSARRESDESGVLTAYVAVLAVALLAIVGMAVDSGRAIASQRLAADEAEQAARFGATRLSLAALRDGQVTLNSAGAVKAAEEYTASSGYPGTATVSNGIVTVRVVVAVPTTILGIVGVSRVVVSATGSASDVSGVTAPDS
jgi:Flp pilus assembly protein TadG